MSQDISPISSSAAIEAYLRSYIFTDADGSFRLNESALLTWLTEQFGYLNGAGSEATPTDKNAVAADIVNRLGSIINRENWASNPAYPRPENNDAETIRSRLVSLRDQLFNAAHAIETPYQDYQAGLAARSKALFNTIVAPNFPAGVAVIEATRVYVETLVTDRGEESRPSDVTVLSTIDQNDTITLTCAAAPGGRNIAYRRIYRSATGTQSSAFKLQGEYPVATTVITDSKPDAQLSDVCPTFGWLEPPAALKGLTGMPNGMMLGYDGRTLYACEPYAPYAFPAKYDKPLAHQITGIVAVGQSAFVGTTGRPYLVSGSDSASLSEELISSREPCVSARSMVAIENSVFYASPNGLALYENGRVVIVSKGVIDRKTWQAYVPSSMRAVEFNGMYLAFFTRSDNSQGCLIFDYETRSFSEMAQTADALFADESGVYALIGTTIYDVLPKTGNYRTGSWYSKTFRLGRPQSFGWLHVDSDFLNNGSAVSATVRIYASGSLLQTLTVSSSAPVRVKPGKHSDWRAEVDCAAQINGVVLATTTEELKAAI